MAAVRPTAGRRVSQKAMPRPTSIFARRLRWRCSDVTAGYGKSVAGVLKVTVNCSIST